jgi:uncharacterized protein (DUF3084 family)
LFRIDSASQQFATRPLKRVARQAARIDIGRTHGPRQTVVTVTSASAYVTEAESVAFFAIFSHKPRDEAW